jgi:hypothetical protein
MRLVVTCLLVWCAVVSVKAQEAPDAEARRLFEEGLALSESNHWTEAVDRFERSLALSDRPGTRFNLMNAYDELGRPLDVARHALGFLALPPEPHRADARASAESALSEAARKLAMLSTQWLPANTELLVDGSAPVVRDANRVFLLPGLHRLEARIPGAAPEIIELHLAGGQELPWPRPGRFEPVAVPSVADTTEPPAPQPRAVIPDAREPAAIEPAWRSRLSIISGTLGATAELTAVGIYALTMHRASELSDLGAAKPGYWSSATDYMRSSNAIAPLAAAGGVLMAQAIATGPRSARWGSRTTAVVALAAGAGLVATGLWLLVRPPDTVRHTGVEEPSRQAGALLVSGAGAFVSYGTSFLVHWYRSSKGVELALGPGR